MLSEIKEETSQEIKSTSIVMFEIPKTFTNTSIQKIKKDSANNHISNNFFQDKVSRKIIIIGFEPVFRNKLVEEFGKFGEIIKVDYQKPNNYIIIKYNKEYEAKNAKRNYDPFLFDTALKEKIISVDFFFEKINEFKIVDKHKIKCSSNKRIEKPITTKIPVKYYIENIFNLFVW